MCFKLSNLSKMMLWYYNNRLRKKQNKTYKHTQKKTKQTNKQMETSTFISHDNYFTITVHGGWTTWTEYPDCPVTCGGATLWRYRNCTNPTPQFNGNECEGRNSSSIVCNGDVQCPGRSFIKGIRPDFKQRALSRNSKINFFTSAYSFPLKNTFPRRN